MKDRFGRKIEYLRLSVTDRCNLRCIYCMAEDGVCKLRHGDILSIEELTEIAAASYDLGIRKIRLTGGEPLVRKGILPLCRNIKAIDPAIELDMTTNGSLLSECAQELKEAGVDRLNISLDTLDPDTYRSITRCGEIGRVLEGIKAAGSAGFAHTKINTVLIGGVNDNDIFDIMRLAKDSDVSVRFIELMPMHITACWDKSRFVTAEVVERHLRSTDLVGFDGVARLYRPQGFVGTVGIISPLSQSFCDRCNKIRVTPDGKLKPCLHSDEEIDLRGLHGEALKEAISQGIQNKPMCHHLNEATSTGTRSMNEIGG